MDFVVKLRQIPSTRTLYPSEESKAVSPSASVPASTAARSIAARVAQVAES